MQFHLLYFTEGIGQYLQDVVRTVAPGEVVQKTQLPPSLADEAAPVNSESPADVWIMEYREGVTGLDHFIETSRHQGNHPAIFLYLEQADTQTLLKALRLGVQECFIGHIKEEEFSAALNRLQRLRQRLTEGTNTRVVAVMGCKGGVGVSFLAANLAQVLAASDGGPILLMDLDLNNSDIGSILDLPARYSIVDVVEKYDNLDSQYLRDVVHRLESGLEVLPGPLRLEDRELVQAQLVQNILEYIRKQRIYRLILLDLGDSLDEVTIKVLEEIDLLLLVVQLTIPALRDAQKILEILLLLEVPAEKIRLVANAYSPNLSITPKEAEKYLAQELLAVLRYDHQAVTRSLNEGRPLVELLPSHKLTNEIKKLARDLSPPEDTNGNRSGIWAKVKNLLRLGG